MEFLLIKAISLVLIIFGLLCIFNYRNRVDNCMGHKKLLNWKNDSLIIWWTGLFFTGCIYGLLEELEYTHLTNNLVPLLTCFVNGFSFAVLCRMFFNYRNS